MKVVLFLGAGFSRAWGLPIMNEFFEHAAASEDIAEEEKEFLRELQRKARRGVSMVEVGARNLEGILSFCLASEDFNAGYPASELNNYDRLCRILQDVYRRVDMGLWNKQRGEYEAVFRRLLGLHERRHGMGVTGITLITTNYDLMVEWLMLRVGLPCTLPGKWVSMRRRSESGASGKSLYHDHAGGHLLCKLHGSLNWFRGDDPGVLGVEDMVQHRDFDIGDAGLKGISVPWIHLSDFKPLTPPLIVPPTLFKMQTDPLFVEIWKAAARALQGADKLCFVGFSFPESDTHIRYFLGANLSENVDLRAIDIIDPQAKAIVERLKGKRQYGSHFTELLHGVEAKWEECNYSVAD